MGDAAPPAHRQEAAAANSPGGSFRRPPTPASSGVARGGFCTESSLQQQGAGQSRKREAGPLHRESSSFSRKGPTGRNSDLLSLIGKGTGSVKGRKGGALDGFLTKQERAAIAEAAAATATTATSAGVASRKENVSGLKRAGYSEPVKESARAQGEEAHGMKEGQFRSEPEDLRPETEAFTPRTTQEVSGTGAIGKTATPVKRVA